ncbi:TRAP transporter small permease [Chelatococcus asaccharovorans]|uniref:TRAP transporter small permease protein n=1 Tax=Chelatococcus asaccharovorans TaxID=28210 RepID=A0A2V3U8Q7_9HYPH|nr:TRAP transporter small permease [Chelatococcus asaccharovorans]MBS7705400.1 TRAP transporter small permease [Chelatococcus asaccharovorans]PXW60196.1 TRAP-type C4-dicarboxylate transport system permease small subunit [Chelatococcus asaccharovorans]CAH1655293.1 TRAP-type C4-dicarboxylate transport system permease small subunit [Chelatococcus asaccharovorans]CAH1685471.1 TRAP-type C4-dicarboxylate transport system permease small subunit [Chelatococcus asaccharovorans]
MTSQSAADAQAVGLQRVLMWPLEEIIAGVSLVVVVGSVVWGVITRYIFPQPAAWSYEVATIAFAYVVFFGAAAGVRYRLHSDIDVLVVMFPERLQRAVSIFNFWLLATFFTALTIFFGIHAIDAQKSLTIALNLPRSVIYAPLALASAMMLLRHVQLWVDPERFPGHIHEANIS